MNRDDETRRSEHDVKRYEGDKHEGPAHGSPYPMSRLAPPYDLVDVAKRIAEADAMIGATTSARLQVIAEQIRALQETARRILEEARKDLELHRARCHFVRRPGRVYHLYRRSDGELWWSMVGPEEWGASPPAEFVGSYRLELDQSWTRVGEGEESTDEGAPHPEQLLVRLLGE